MKREFPKQAWCEVQNPPTFSDLTALKEISLKNKKADASNAEIVQSLIKLSTKKLGPALTNFEQKSGI